MMGRKTTCQAGRVRPGALLFFVLAAAVAVRYGWIYLDRSTRLTSQAKELMAQGKYDSALTLLEQAVADSPDDADAHYHRGLCLAEKRRFEEALQALGRVLELDPGQANAAFNRAKILEHLDRCQEALAEIEIARKYMNRLVEPNRPALYLLEGECRYRMLLRQVANNPEIKPDASAAKAAFLQYLRDRPGAPDRGAVRQKLEILDNPRGFPQILGKYRKRK